ncbi:hypothetical protein pb186bvf_006055 [Paramecium bursaria]
MISQKINIRNNICKIQFIQSQTNYRLLAIQLYLQIALKLLITLLISINSNNPEVSSQVAQSPLSNFLRINAPIANIDLQTNYSQIIYSLVSQNIMQYFIQVE